MFCHWAILLHIDGVCVVPALIGGFGVCIDDHCLEDVGHEKLSLEKPIKSLKEVWQLTIESLQAALAIIESLSMWLVRREL